VGERSVLPGLDTITKKAGSSLAIALGTQQKVQCIAHRIHRRQIPPLTLTGMYVSRHESLVRISIAIEFVCPVLNCFSTQRLILGDPFTSALGIISSKSRGSSRVAMPPRIEQIISAKLPPFKQAVDMEKLLV